MQPLNLPKSNLDITRTSDGSLRIYDRLRHKNVTLTPEEWVRQNFVNYMIDTLGYPEGLMGNEISIKLNETSRRCDTVVFNRKGQPMMIVEYKAPSIAVSQKTFDQIVRYNMVLHARYLVVSNGLSHYCCEIDYNSHSYRFVDGLPPYAKLNA